MASPSSSPTSSTCATAELSGAGRSECSSPARRRDNGRTRPSPRSETMPISSLTSQASANGTALAAQSPIVFLHIPKTAGQTIHNALAAMVGGRHVSPIRTHTQAPGDAPQMPAGYALYSGHIDWTELETLPGGRFTFTVLRDPRERIASFYFFLLKEAEALDRDALERPQNYGKKLILQRSADDYFFGGPAGFNAFILDHYDNFY